MFCWVFMLQNPSIFNRSLLQDLAASRYAFMTTSSLRDLKRPQCDREARSAEALRSVVKPDRGCRVCVGDDTAGLSHKRLVRRRPICTDRAAGRPSGSAYPSFFFECFFKFFIGFCTMGDGRSKAVG